MSSPTGPIAPPSGLREQVIGRSLGLRPAGRATPEAPWISAVEAFRRTAHALSELLDTLPEEQWRQAALRGLDVQGLIGHLIGVEEHVQQALAGDPAPSRADHVASTQPFAAGQAGVPVAATRAAFADAVAASVQQLTATDPADPITLYGARSTVAGLCIARAFELWTHENDIRQALGLKASQPDASTLTLMTGLATELLPRAAVRHLPRPVELRLVLTGAGGGTWQLSIGEPASTGSETIGVVADAVDFCRLVANRTTHEELDTYVTGDPRLAEAVLEAATTLALD